MSCIPSRSALCQEFTSRITESAWSIQVLLLPIDDEGTSAPSAVIPLTSTRATSRCPRKPIHTICATCDRWTSMYSMWPLLIFSRLTGSDWYGSRSSIPSTAARAPSSSGAVDAPVQTLILKRSPELLASVIRFARAAGTSLGYPAPVNPLIPTVAPGLIMAAAASAGTAFRANPAWLMRPLPGMVAHLLRGCAGPARVSADRDRPATSHATHLPSVRRHDGGSPDRTRAPGRRFPVQALIGASVMASARATVWCTSVRMASAASD